MPMISVCMTTYNGEKYILEQLLSILNQLNENDEIVISDDSSSDQTTTIIENLKDKRIKLLKNNTFRSPIFNLENALKNSSGNYIFLADQDDIWFQNKIEEMSKHITTNNVVMSDATLVDLELNVTSNSLNSWRHYRSGFFKNLYKSRYLGCCMAFSDNFKSKILPFPKNIKAHDVWIGLYAELSDKVTYIPLQLIKYRRHESNYSTASLISKNSILTMISYRVYFFIQILVRFIKNTFLK